MHVICVNYTFDPEITNPDTLLDRYETLVSWADAIKRAGAAVSVVQRFGVDVRLKRNDVPYQFVYDPTLQNGSVLDLAKRTNSVIVAAEPDIVHVNGLQFARQAWHLKRLLRRTPVLLQDHKNPVPGHWLNRWTLGRALHRMEAISFVSRVQALPWIEAGLLHRDQTIVELMEGSSRFKLKPQSAARAQTGLTGSPLCLWVGKLVANKDPLTVLRGFAKAFASLPGARLAMIYGSTELLPMINQWLAEHPSVSKRVQLLGQRPHADLEDVYNSADLFLLGSHNEGSGYAVLEALACGVVPILSEIPSFRVLTGGGTVGGLWPCGDADALAKVLRLRSSTLNQETRREVRAYFEKHFHWNAIGPRAVDTYRKILSPPEKTERSR